MRRVGSVVIVGGGSSGWMAAAYLAKLFPDLTITLVESKRVPVIGVGEATVPLLNLFMERLGYSDPQRWMPDCDATFKTGILFENWHHAGDRYWHPFDRLDYVGEEHHSGHCWLTWRDRGDPRFQSRRSYYEAFFTSTRLNADELRAPSFWEVAYHIDAFRFGDFLRATAPSVRHVLDDVGEVVLDDDGAIAALRTAVHGDLVADLYVDCTGFRRRIMAQVAPHQSFDSYADSLFCDRAVVIRMPYGAGDDRERIVAPYVRASARSAGWIWSIPLYSRMSSGYVYSSRFLSEEDAESELRAYWKGRDLDEIEALKVRFQTGKLERSWVKNCIAIGLAGGFIEPLESTGLAITQMGIEMAASMLDARFYDDEIVDRYNAHLSKFYRDIVQFVVAHYCLTEREDTPFWRTVKHDTVVPQDLAARLDVFRHLLPTAATRGTQEVFMFRDVSWFAVLLGMDFPFTPEPVGDKQLTAAHLVAERKREQIREMQAKLPNHYRFLKERIYGRP